MKGALFTICKVVSKCALQFDKLEFVSNVRTELHLLVSHYLLYTGR